MRAVSALLSAAIAISLLVGCISPGKRYGYLDIKFGTSPVAATPAQPAVNQPTTVTFSIFNAFDEPLTGVAWSAAITDATGVVAAFPLVPSSDTVSIDAFGIVNQLLSFTPTAPGTYTVTITLDPANVIAERNETDNVGTVTVVVADHDLSFGLPSATILDSVTPATPHSVDNLTLTFAIADTLNPGHSGLTTVTANYAVLLNGAPVGLVSASPASGFTIDGAATSSTLVTVTLPPTGSAGAFAYTINLSATPPEDESNLTNNSVTLVFAIPAGN
jgi:hypothetical protein